MLMSKTHLPLLSLLVLTLACEQPAPPPATPALATPAAEVDASAGAEAKPAPSALALQRVERMRERFAQSPCAKGAQAEPWNKQAEEVYTTYEAGRYTDSIEAAQRAFALCADPTMMRHIAHCYNLMGMPAKAAESNRRLKGSLRETLQRRIQRKTDAAPTPSPDAKPLRTQEP